MKVVVLGAGLVGGPMAIDLAKNPSFEVTVADIDPEKLERLGTHKLTTRCVDLSSGDAVGKLASESDLVLSAVPGFMGFKTLETIIEAGKNVVDIAFFPEDCFLLNDKARDHGVTAIVDCGVAPGMSNLLAGHVSSILDSTDTILIYVGGLPETREWPYEYKAVFSPIDVIEEYTRPARYVENGHLVTRPALSDPEYLDFPGIGTLEAFNSDGLRTLADTIDAPNMKEKTMRYPGHIEKMTLLRETGFFSQDEIEINGVRIRPLDFTAKLLFPKWQMKEGDVDITIMKVVVEGEKDEKKLRYTYDLIDKHDPVTMTHSMARTTGYTATAAIQMLAEGLFSKRGVNPPEFIGKQPECVSFILEYLEARGVVYRETIETLV